MESNTAQARLDTDTLRTGIDLEGFRQGLEEHGLADLVDELIETFLQDAPSRFDALEAAIVAEDAEQIRRAAHACGVVSAGLKGVRPHLTRLPRIGFRLARLPRSALVVAQHMPEGFTAALARRLNQVCPIERSERRRRAMPSFSAGR